MTRASSDMPGRVFMADLPQMQAWAEGMMACRPLDFVIGDDYLRRWWVIPRNPLCGVYLHDIRAFHDHPWPNTSVLLLGSYVEHTPDGTFVRQAGDVINRAGEAPLAIDRPWLRRTRSAGPRDRAALRAQAIRTLAPPGP